MFQRILSIDERVIAAIPKLYSKRRNQIMIYISKSGNNGLVWILFILPFLFVSKWQRTGINLIIAMALVHIIGEVIIKHIVCRTRPSHYIQEEDMIVKHPRYYSFPSGHTAASFSIAAAVMLKCPLYIAIPVLIYATLIGFSRLYLRVHYLTDVIVGMLLGLICGFLSVQFLNQIYY
ncbi:MAG: phosphatase PAP2 family protein [Bacillota bacterium]|nr:phosphatase PAP2 family protein [Bacillota bacterium]